MAHHAPFRLKKFLHYQNSIRSLVDQSTDPVVRKSWDIFDEYRYSAKSYYYIDDIMNRDASVDELEALLKDESAMNEAIWSLNNRDGIIGSHSIQTKLKELATKRARLWNSTTSTTEIRGLAWDEITPILIYGHGKVLDARLSKIVYELPNKGESLTLAPIKRILLTDLQDFLQRLVELELIDTLNGMLDEPARIYIAENMPNHSNEYISRFRSYYSSILQPKKVVIQPKKEISAGKKKKYKAPEPIPLIELSLDDYRKEEIQFRNNVGIALANMETLVEDPFAYEKLMYAAEHNPTRVLNNYPFYINEYYAMDVLERCAKAAPMSAKKFLAKRSHIVYQFLETSSDPVIQKMFEIKETLGPYTRAYFLLDDLYHHRMSFRRS